MDYLIILAAALVAVGTSFFTADQITDHKIAAASAAASSSTTAALAAAGITAGTNVSSMIAVSVDAVARRLTSETDTKLVTVVASVGTLHGDNADNARRLTALERKDDPRRKLLRDAEILNVELGAGHAAALCDMHGKTLTTYFNRLEAALKMCAKSPEAAYEKLRKEYLADIESGGYNDDETIVVTARKLVASLDRIHAKAHAEATSVEYDAHGAWSSVKQIELQLVREEGIRRAIAFEQIRHSIGGEPEETTSGELEGGSD